VLLFFLLGRSLNCFPLFLVVLAYPELAPRVALFFAIASPLKAPAMATGGRTLCRCPD